jgi:hypothetical protein
MRYAQATGALALVLVLCGPGLAQVGTPDIRVVKVDVAEVRPKPSSSDHFYVTNRLKRGTTVEVVRELDGGWLEIKPPAGSFSWINTRFLEHIALNQPNYVVALEGTKVEVYMGSEVMTDRRPTVIGAYVQRGAQVTSMGKTMNSDSEGTWMRIEPPANEVRYLRATDVERQGSTTPGFQQASANGASTPAGPAGPLERSSAPSANIPPTPEQMWQQAVQAERAGNPAAAVPLYLRVADAAARTNPQLAMAARTRAADLQGGYRETSGGVAPQVLPPPPPSTIPGNAVRLNAPRSPDGTTTGISRSPVNDGDPNRGRSGSSALPQGYVSFTGKLVRAGRTLGPLWDRQALYRLESVQTGVRMPLTYVIAGRGVNLEPHVGRAVEVAGPGHYDGELRSNVLRAMQVVPQP